MTLVHITSVNSRPDARNVWLITHTARPMDNSGSIGGANPLEDLAFGAQTHSGERLCVFSPTG
jgi:hypothetical protein